MKRHMAKEPNRCGDGLMIETSTWPTWCFDRNRLEDNKQMHIKKDTKQLSSDLSSQRQQQIRKREQKNKFPTCGPVENRRRIL